jgi:hypothetical protein
MKKQGKTKAKGTAAPHAHTMTRGTAGFSPVLDWGGVRIVVPPSVKVRRLLPGAGVKAVRVEMDLRAFVPSKASSVVERWVRDRIAERKRRATWPLADLLETRANPGWFDATAHLVADATDPVFSKAALTIYTPWYEPADFERFARWKGHPISGRYSMHNDSHDAIETVTNLPSDSAIPKALQSFVGSLPHHNEIAVDEDGDHTNKLYGVKEYRRHFALRYHLALRHITAVFAKHPGM